jgi:hypothetical protein
MGMCRAVMRQLASWRWRRRPVSICGGDVPSSLPVLTSRGTTRRFQQRSVLHLQVTCRGYKYKCLYCEVHRAADGVGAASHLHHRNAEFRRSFSKPAPTRSHLFLHLQWLLHVRPAAAGPVLPGGGAWLVSALFSVIFIFWPGFSPFWVGASV